MDGVLVDTAEQHYEAWRWLAASRGRELTREEFVPTFGMRNPDAIDRLFGALPEAEVRRMSDEKEAEFRRRLRGRVRALPGADALARALHGAGHPQAIASSSPLENIRLILRELDLTACFREVASGEEVVRGKPDPEIFLLAAARLGVPPGECVVIEDAVVGVRAARRAGMTVYAVTTTWGGADLAQADRVVDSLEELAPADFLLA